MFTRRKFLRSSAGVGLGVGLGSMLPNYATGSMALNPFAPEIPVDLAIGHASAQIAGIDTTVTGINGTVPGPLIRFVEGQEAILRVTNNLQEDTSIHWHGLLLPFQMDGVPGVSFPGIKPGETFEYRFPVRQTGTYWYHSHSGLQEQSGVYGPIVIDPAGSEPQPYDREFVIVLGDWTFANPHHILNTLRKNPAYFNFQRRTIGDLIRDSSRNGLGRTLRERLAWGRMRMDATDVADVTSATYHYLMNGMAPSDNWTGIFQPGERVRLRFINAGAGTFFDVRIPGLPMTVVQADGQDIQPVTVDEFRIAIAETYDVIVEPQEDRPYAVFAESMDRSGYAMGTLASKVPMQATVPERRSRPVRGMGDMGMDMDGMDMDGMDMGGMDMDGMDMDGMDMAGMDHSAHMPAKPDTMAAMDGMDHSAHMPAKPDTVAAMDGMDHAAPMPAKPDTLAAMAAMAGMDHSAPMLAKPDTVAAMAGMDHAGHMPAVANEAAAAMDHAGMPTGNLAPAGSIPSTVSHGSDSHGPSNAAVPMEIRSRLHEPGLGLGQDGRRVLVYTDLKGLNPVEDEREPGRELEIHITGNMERYMWSFDGKTFSQVDGPIQFEHGERLRLTLINDTMMEHPIHLHGMWMVLENGTGHQLPRKHTLNVKPAERLSVLITADAPGRWAFHCHILYHMEMGMFRIVEVTNADMGEAE
jgi:CopA family copper-resistance protein